MTIKKKPSKFIRGEGIVPLVEQFQQTKSMQKMWAEKQAELRDRLLKALTEEGVEDDKEHLWIDLPQEVDGIKQVCRQKRMSQILQEDVAERELRKLGIWEECTMQVTVIDEDTILAKGFEKEIPEEVMALLYEDKITYALVLK